MNGKDQLPVFQGLYFIPLFTLSLVKKCPKIATLISILDRYDSASSRCSPSASVDGRSLIENRIASSLLVFSWECHCQEGTTKMSPLFQLNSLAEILVMP